MKRQLNLLVRPSDQGSELAHRGYHGGVLTPCDPLSAVGRSLVPVSVSKATASTVSAPSSDVPAVQAGRHAELVDVITQAQFRYYVLDAPTMTDGEFDT